jgi:hypothetical protein
MSILVPVTQEDYGNVTTTTVSEILGAVTTAQLQNDVVTSNVYSTVIKNIIDNISIIPQSDAVLSTIQNWNQANSYQNSIISNALGQPVTATVSNTSVMSFNPAPNAIPGIGPGVGSANNLGFAGLGTNLGVGSATSLGFGDTSSLDLTGGGNTRVNLVDDFDDPIAQTSLLNCLNDPTKKPIIQIKIKHELYQESFNSTNPDFAFIDNVFRCRLVADIWHCCPGEETTLTAQRSTISQKNEVKKLKSRVILAEPKLSYWYEECGADGKGRRPVYQFYFDQNDIIDPTSWKQFDSNENMVPLDPSIVDLLINGKAQSLGQALYHLGDATSCTFSHDASFQWIEYLDHEMGKYGFRPADEAEIFNGSPENVQRLGFTDNPDRVKSVPGSVGGNRVDKIAYGYRSTCAGKGDCIGEQKTVDCVTVETPSPSVIRNQKDAYGNDLPLQERILNTEYSVRVENHPCYEATRVTYGRFQPIEREWTITTVCPGKPDVVTKEWRVDNSSALQPTDTVIRFVDVKFAFDESGNLKYPGECIGKEVARDEEPYIDKNDPCGCYEILASRITIQYPDYLTLGSPGYVKGPEIASKIDYSGLGPGLKLNRKIRSAECIDEPIRIYHALFNGKDILSGKETIRTRGLFNGSQSLDCIFTASMSNTSSYDYYYEITDCADCDRTPYFGIAYGHRGGSGSIYSGYEVMDSPTKAMYTQARLMGLEMPEKYFKFYENNISTEADDIYVINFNREAFGTKIDPGNFEINLAQLNGGAYSNNFYTGSNVQVSSSGKVISLIDTSGDYAQELYCQNSVYTSYYLISGSLLNGAYNPLDTTLNAVDGSVMDAYGIVFPNIGIIVLNASKLNSQLSFNTVTGSNIRGDNAYKLYTSISGAAALGHPMKARSVDQKTTNHYFIRVGAATSNWSNNPTYVIDDPIDSSIGTIKHNCFTDEPITYITTVGLYNNALDLLAVAKLSKPIKKTENTDVLLKIRLNW